LKTPLCTHLFHLAESAIINNNQIITRRGVFRAFISARQPLVLLSGSLSNSLYGTKCTRALRLNFLLSMLQPGKLTLSTFIITVLLYYIHGA
jgi:hypothetical protein